jgi:hypothetical protein
MRMDSNGGRSRSCCLPLEAAPLRSTRASRSSCSADLLRSYLVTPGELCVVSPEDQRLPFETPGSATPIVMAIAHVCGFGDGSSSSVVDTLYDDTVSKESGSVIACGASRRGNDDGQ